MLNSEVIKPALRSIGVLRAGRDPTQAQSTEALETLAGLIVSLTEGILGGAWVDQDISTDMLAEENDRLRVVGADAITINLPVTTNYRERTIDTCGYVTICTCCTNQSRAPLDGSKVWICDIYNTVSPRLYLYRADAGDWFLANTLTYAGECPLGEQYRLGLIGMLAENLAAFYGAELPVTTAKQAAMGRLQLASRSTAQNQSTPAEYF